MCQATTAKRFVSSDNKCIACNCEAACMHASYAPRHRPGYADVPSFYRTLRKYSNVFIPYHSHLLEPNYRRLSLFVTGGGSNIRTRTRDTSGSPLPQDKALIDVSIDRLYRRTYHAYIRGQDIIDAVFLPGLVRDQAYGWLRAAEDEEPILILAFTQYTS